MSRRPPRPAEADVDFRLGRMAPGGVLWSEAPIRRTRGRRLLAMASAGPPPVVTLRWRDYPPDYRWADHPPTLRWADMHTLADLGVDAA